MMLGILWLNVPFSICFFCLWRLEKREKEHYLSLFLKSNTK